MTMWKDAFLVCRYFWSQKCLRIFRSCGDPQYGTTLKDGTNRDTSCCQLCRVEAGVMTRKGPQISKQNGKISLLRNTKRA